MLDVTKPNSIVAGVETAAKMLGGRIDVLVNNAGWGLVGALEETSVDEAHDVFEANFFGQLNVTRAVLPIMRAQGSGHILAASAIGGFTGFAGLGVYSAAKAAVLSLTKFLAREWAPRGVRVNAISPGFFPAEQNRALLFQEDGSYSERGRQIIGHTPMARFGDPRELAGAVVWLAAARASSFVTGQNIVVDGGFSAVTI